MYIGRAGRHPATAALRELTKRESERLTDAGAVFAAFTGRVEAQRTALRELLGDLRSKGTRLAGYGATEKAGQNNCSERGCPWNHVQYDADEHDRSDHWSQRHGVPELAHSVHHRLNRHQFRDAVEYQEQHDDAAHDSAGPKSLLRHYGFIGLHLFLPQVDVC